MLSSRGRKQQGIQRPGMRVRNMKSMLPLVAIFFMTNFYRAMGRGMAPSAPLDPLLGRSVLCIFHSCDKNISYHVLIHVIVTCSKFRSRFDDTKFTWHK